MRTLGWVLAVLTCTGCFDFSEARSRYCGRSPSAPGCGSDAGEAPDAGGDAGLDPCAPELQACAATQVCTVEAGQARCGCASTSLPVDGGCEACPAGQANEKGVCTDAFTQLSPGRWATCGIRVDGTLWCWGSAPLARTGPRGLILPTPAQRSGGTWKDVSVAEHHACAIDSAGALWCWGENWEGELGTGAGSEADPARVTPPEGVTWADVELGEVHTCAISTAGALYCWGRNLWGQVGQPEEIPRVAVPTQVGISTGWTDVSLGSFHSCGVDRGGLYCWGENFVGQVGNPDTSRSFFSPIALQGAGANQGWTEVASGHVFNCGLRAGEVYCWGHDELGQLGSEEVEIVSAVPVKLDLGGAAWSGLTAGLSHACASGPEKTLCWGRSDLGQLGDAHTTADGPLHVEPAGPSFSRVSAGGETTCALRPSGVGYCWGSGASGQLGQGPRHSAYLYLPTEVKDVSGASVRPIPDPGGALVRKSVAATAQATCAIEDGGTRCWGFNAGGRFGVDEESRARPDGFTLPRFESVALGAAHGCGISFAGEISCWGSNASGQLGETLLPESPTPLVIFGRSFLSVCSGVEHSCAITEADLELKCWGSNGSGQLGVPGITSSGNVLRDVSFGPNGFVESVACGAHHTCAVVAESGVRRVDCWGKNDRGQVNGVPDTSFVASPVTVIAALNGAFNVSAGFDSSWLVEESGEQRATCWGDNAEGQCDVPHRADGGTLAPIRWPGSDSHVVEASPGARHSCLRWNDGGMSCRGTNSDWQLGSLDVEARQVSLPGPWVDVTAGGTQSCGVRESGELLCWGSGASGELGNNDAFETAPVEITLP